MFGGITMDENRRVENLNNIIASFSERIREVSGDLSSQTDRLNEEIENGLNAGAERAPYKEPENFNKFQRKYQVEFYEKRELDQIAKEDAAIEEGIKLEDERIEAEKGALEQVQGLVAEFAKGADEMRSFLNRVNAELSDLSHLVAERKEEFVSIGNDPNLSQTEKIEKRNELRGSLAGVSDRLNTLKEYQNRLTSFLNTYDNLSLLEKTDTMEVNEELMAAVEALDSIAPVKDTERELPKVQHDAAPEIEIPINPNDQPTDRKSVV